MEAIWFVTQMQYAAQEVKRNYKSDVWLTVHCSSMWNKNQLDVT